MSDRILGYVMYSLLAAVLLIAQSSTSHCSSDSFSSPSPACPGENVTFHCTVCDPISFNTVTLWLVDDRLPPCLVQNEVLDETDTCGPGRKFTSQAGEPDGAGCYPSTLSATAELGLNGVQVGCAQGGEDNLVGNGTLNVIGPASISIIKVQLNDTSNVNATVTVHVHVETDSESISSYTIISIPALMSCGGQCVVRKGENGFESRQLNLTVDICVEYSITVRADNCNDSQNGTESRPHRFTICVPGPDTVKGLGLHPLYSQLSHEILRVNISWDSNVSDPKVRGIEGVTGHLIYKYILTVDSKSMTVNSSECVGERCSYMFNATGLNLPPQINISVAAVNDFGSGPASQQQTVFSRNLILHISVEDSDDFTDWRVICSFLSAFPGSDATCRIDYGTDSSYTNLPYSDESTETGGANDSVSIQLQRLNSTTTYYYRVSAIESLSGGCIITVQGSFTTGIFSCKADGFDSALITALLSSLLAIFLFAGVLFGVLSCYCSRRRKPYTVQLSSRQQSSQSVQPQTQSTRTTEPEYEEVIPKAGVDIELADNVAYQPLAKKPEH